MSALAIERYSRNRKFNVLCSGGRLPPSHSHPSFSCIYIYNGSHLMHRLSLSPPEKTWQAARMSSGTTHYLPHPAVHWVEICPVDGGLQCSGCYFGFLSFQGRILFWLRTKVTALFIPKQDFFKRMVRKKQ